MLSYQFALGGGYSSTRRAFDRPRQRLLMNNSAGPDLAPIPTTVKSLAAIVRGPNPFLINNKCEYGEWKRQYERKQGCVRTTRNQRRPVASNTESGIVGVSGNRRVKMNQVNQGGFVKDASTDDVGEASGGEDHREEDQSVTTEDSEVSDGGDDANSGSATLVADEQVDVLESQDDMSQKQGAIPLMKLEVVLGEAEVEKLKEIDFPTEITVRIPETIMAELACRFIVNLPKHERDDMNRVMFHTEAAFWFFVDQFTQNPDFPECYSMSRITHLQFAYNMIYHTPGLKPLFKKVPNLLYDYREYRKKIPTCGGILLSPKMQWVLLVKGFGGKWSFPKGKMNENEDLFECAVREVYEETGYNIRQSASRKYFIDGISRFGSWNRRDRLYIVPNVDYYSQFDPQTNYEIKEIAWFGVNDLPENKSDTLKKAVSHSGGSVNDFFLVFPYVRKLKIWIADKQHGRNKIASFEIPERHDEPNHSHESFMEPELFREEKVEENKSLLAGLQLPSVKDFESNDPPRMDVTFSKSRQPDEKVENEDNSSPATAGENTEDKTDESSFPVNETGEVVQVAESHEDPEDVTVHRHTGRFSDFDFYPSCWKNFSLDKDRIYQALYGEISIQKHDDDFN